MAYAEDSPSTFNRGRDEETQAYLLHFFREQAKRPGFEARYKALSADEQKKLMDCMNQQE